MLQHRIPRLPAPPMTAALLVLLALLVLGGCRQELFRALPERDVNEVIAVLAQSSIDAEKVSLPKSEAFQVIVDSQDFSAAVGILSARGLPRRKHDNLGEIFQPSGLVPTPFEEQVRLVYGVSEELSETLSRFNGITENRVHIVLPHEVGRDIHHEARASVYLQYDPEFDVEILIPRIRRLVSDSVDGLESTNVEVLAEPRSQLLSATPPPLSFRTVAGIGVRAEHIWRFFALMAGMAVMMVTMAVLLLWLLLARGPTVSRS
ncbi:MAG: type III secretion inner membrane ring lipoprotein SctJ [Alphaproteobacteria bacterium]